MEYMEDTDSRLTRKQRRASRNNRRINGNTIEKNNIQKASLVLKHIDPLTENQKKAFSSYRQSKNLLLIGSPGTGKSFCASYLAMKDILDTNCDYEKLYICRSAQPTKDVGFLPGSLKEKIKIYEAPYVGIFSEIFGRGDAYDVMKNKGAVEFISTSYIRGITLDNCVVIVEECQNLAWNELFAIMTRVGKNCRIMFTGDYRQSDLRNTHKDDTRKEDILKFIDVLKEMKHFETVEFGHNDILRSETVKEFIITSERLGFS